MKVFSKEKFLSLPKQQQHKKACELVRVLYDSILADKEYEGLGGEYDAMASWLGEESLKKFTLEAIADRYHYHCKKGQVYHKEHNLLPRVRTGDADVVSSPALPIAIYLENIRSAHNVGSIIRTVEAMGLGSIHFSSETAFTDNKQVKDTAMGAESWVECHRDVSIEDLPRPLIAVETAEDAIPLNSFVFPETFTLAVGNEEYGCSDAFLKAADYVIYIPQYGRKNSLNVANAFAVVAGEITRQKRTML